MSNLKITFSPYKAICNMSNVTIINGEVMDVLSRERFKCHSFFFDPPYGYEGGFMGYEWDQESIAFRPEFWSLLHEHSLPGGIGNAFSSPENYDIMCSAIRDSEFSVLPMMIAWVQSRSKPSYVTISESHVYGKHAVKPSAEPLVVFQAKHKKRRSDIDETGAGVINLDGHSTSRDGTKRFPSSVVLDSETGELLNKSTGRDVDFFFSVVQSLQGANPLFYEPKANRKERDAGLEEMDDTKVGVYSGRRDGSLGSTPVGKNDHPTVKPIATAIHFTSLLLPEKRFAPNRTLMVPFCGVGSEVIGAVKAGWDHVIGIEQEERYCDIALKRIEHHITGVNLCYISA